MEALNKIQTELNAPKNQRNKFGNYNYRNCEDILQAVKPLLQESKAILLLNDDIVEIADRVFVKATATLKCKEESETVTAYAELPLNRKGMDLAQVTGASSSYARKYALNGLFAIDDNKDPDAQKQPDKNQSSKPNKRLDLAIKDLSECLNVDDLTEVWKSYRDLQTNETFKTQVKEAKEFLTKQTK